MNNFISEVSSFGRAQSLPAALYKTYADRHDRTVCNVTNSEAVRLPFRPHLVFQGYLLALNTANDDIGSILGNDLVVVQHLKFLRCISAHV